MVGGREGVVSDGRRMGGRSFRRSSNVVLRQSRRFCSAALWDVLRRCMGGIAIALVFVPCPWAWPSAPAPDDRAPAPKPRGVPGALTTPTEGSVGSITGVIGKIAFRLGLGLIALPLPAPILRELARDAVAVMRVDGVAPGPGPAVEADVGAPVTASFPFALLVCLTVVPLPLLVLVLVLLAPSLPRFIILAGVTGTSGACCCCCWV
ncbi:hypothetical protein B0H34DRAFT_713620 [Crassisporium funariophilum]|nr:hypothetical protein B0H34DRAFT_713620 [Crassisporium funariophilum]